jgi:4-amino-4-deoxy-L-arabinose transferase-like glycosyltransferase
MAGRRRADWGWWLVAAVALQRIVFVATTRHDPVFRVPYLDGAFYHVWARSLAEGRGDFQGPYFLGPLYPHALALLYRGFGADPFVARVVQSILGISDVALVYALGSRLFGFTAGAIGAAALALHGPLLFYENLLVVDVLQLALALSALVVALSHRRREWVRAPLVGALLGAAVLVRPTALVLLPVAAWTVVRDAGTRAAWVRTAALLAAAALVLLPCVARNARLGAGWTVTTNGGVNFYAGNGPGANGRFHEPEGVHFFSAPVLSEAARGASLPSAIADRALTVEAAAGTADAANSSLWWARARAWMRAHPATALSLPFRRAWLLLQARDIAQVESYSFHARRLWMLRLCCVDFGWLWPLAFLGLWRARRERDPRARVVMLWALALLVPSLLFFVTGRHRLVAAPEVAILAGAGGAALLDDIRRRAYRSAWAALACMLPIAIAARSGARPPRSAAGWENAQMAERLYASGDLNGAIAAQEQAMREAPDRFEVPLDLALYWSERAATDDLANAEHLLRGVVSRWPDRPIGLYNLGLVLDRRGAHDEARAAWRHCLELDPTFEPARARVDEALPDSSSTPSHRVN